eukprot:3157049-Pyramimonas_sp.AAC.1
MKGTRRREGTEGKDGHHSALLRRRTQHKRVGNLPGLRLGGGSRFFRWYFSVQDDFKRAFDAPRWHSKMANDKRG